MREKRIEKLRRVIERNRADGLMISSNANLFYLSGFRGSSGLGVVTREDLLLLVDGRYVEQAEQEAPGWRIERIQEDVTSTLRVQLESLRVRMLGIESELVTYAAYEDWRSSLENVQLLPTRRWVEGLRAVKDATEIAALRKAVALGEHVLERVVPRIGPGMTEKDVAADLEDLARRSGADDTSFKTIVVSGTRTSLPHGRPTAKVLRPGDLLTIDFGVMLDGYCSDITRTCVVGDCERRQREVYEAVLKCHRTAAAAIRPGMTGVEAQGIAEEVLQGEGLAEYFVHGLGHGVGLEIHEAPRLGRSREAQEPLEPGMTVTVEPGVYIEGWGGVRIEDLYLVGQKGLEDLNEMSKELRVLG